MSARVLAGVGGAGTALGGILLVLAAGLASVALAGVGVVLLAGGQAAVIALVVRLRRSAGATAPATAAGVAESRSPTASNRVAAGSSADQSSPAASTADEPSPAASTADEPSPAAAPTADAPPAPVVALHDPDADALRGALTYLEVSRELPDDRPDPALEVAGDPDADGLVVWLEQRSGDERLATHRLEVTRLALERAACPPRRRVHPAETTVLVLHSSDRIATPTLTALDEPPAGMTEHVDDRLGPPLLPPAGRDRLDVEVAWLPAQQLDRTVADQAVSWGRQRRCVVIPAPLGGDPTQRAALLLRLTGAGVACLATPDALRGLDLLSAPLLTSMDAQAVGGALGDEVGHPVTDDLALAALTARQKRAAWRDHDLRLVWGPDQGSQLATGGDALGGLAAGGTSVVGDVAVGGGAGRSWRPQLRPVRRPSVTVALTSRRPAALPSAIAMLAAQRDVDVEVVVALHGVGNVEQVERQLAAAELPGRVLALDATVPFGAAINAAVAAGSGELVLKWDDDDLYGPDHVLDLVLAQRQTGAGLVGKAPEFVHFEADGHTIWRTPGRAEAPSLGLAGGTFLTPRALLDELGGYPPVTRSVDHHLKHRVQDAGVGVFRTHGFGFVLRRHAQGHTWEGTEDRYRSQAQRTFEHLPAVLELGTAAALTHLAVDVATAVGPAATDRDEMAPLAPHVADPDGHDG